MKRVSAGVPALGSVGRCVCLGVGHGLTSASQSRGTKALFGVQNPQMGENAIKLCLDTGSLLVQNM